jgi:hypothetical protein
MDLGRRVGVGNARAFVELGGKSGRIRLRALEASNCTSNLW